MKGMRVAVFVGLVLWGSIAFAPAASADPVSEMCEHRVPDALPVSRWVDPNLWNKIVSVFEPNPTDGMPRDPLFGEWQGFVSQYGLCEDVREIVACVSAAIVSGGFDADIRECLFGPAGSTMTWITFAPMQSQPVVTVFEEDGVELRREYRFVLI